MPPSTNDERPLLPAVVGPTGVGKTEMAVRIGEALGGEVVVADSRQVYRHLHIATNHPSANQRRRVRFHMIEVVEPSAAYSVHDFVLGATEAIGDILARGRVPILEGGTGLYLDALLDGYDLTLARPRPDRREALERLETPALVSYLDQLDPTASVDRSNRRRLVRAIEILEVVGPPLAAARGRRDSPWRGIRVGLTAPRSAIDVRLEERTRAQLQAGLVAETRWALEHGIPATAAVLTGIGYADTVRHLQGELDQDGLEGAIARSNRRYARRQETWWRRDQRVRWFANEPDPLPSILKYLDQQAWRQ